MKPYSKIILGLFLLLALSAQASAETYGPRKPASVDPSRFDVRFFWGMNSEIVGSEFATGNDDWGYYVPYDYSMKDVYTDIVGPSYTLGSLGAGVSYKITRWLSVSGDLGTSIYWHDLLDSKTQAKKKTQVGAYIYLMPSVKFVFLNRPNVRLYSSAGLGVALRPGFHLLDESLVTGTLQITAFGVEFGNKIFGLAETGFGYVYTGLRFGVGYKF